MCSDACRECMSVQGGPRSATSSLQHLGGWAFRSQRHISHVIGSRSCCQQSDQDSMPDFDTKLEGEGESILPNHSCDVHMIAAVLEVCHNDVIGLHIAHSAWVCVDFVVRYTKFCSHDHALLQGQEQTGPSIHTLDAMVFPVTACFHLGLHVLRASSTCKLMVARQARGSLVSTCTLNSNINHEKQRGSLNVASSCSWQTG